MMSAKIATSGLLRITIFWNKSYDVKILVLDVTNKILLRDSNYIVDVVIWPKFVDYSNISMGEVITTSILLEFDQKNRFFCGVVLVQVQEFGKLEILHQCGKRVKTKSQKVLVANSYICRCYREKTGRGRFYPRLPSWIGLK